MTTWHNKNLGYQKIFKKGWLNNIHHNRHHNRQTWMSMNDPLAPYNLQMQRDFLSSSTHEVKLEILQGMFLKKQKVPNGVGGWIEVPDFHLGKDICIFGHTYHIVGCDTFTKVNFNNLHLFISFILSILQEPHFPLQKGAHCDLIHKLLSLDKLSYSCSF